MNKASTNKELEFKEMLVRSASKALSSSEFIRNKQKLALDQIQDIGFPNKADEDWKYFDFSEILEASYNINNLKSAESSSGLSLTELNQLIDKYVFDETVENLLVTVNGAYQAELSNFKHKPPGIHILNLNDQEALEANPKTQEIIAKLFANRINKETKYFKAINTALMNNAFLLYVEDNCHCDKPLQILHISNQNNFNQIRSLISVGKNSSLNINVSYIGLEGSKYLTNAMIEIDLQAGARAKLTKIQNESKEASCFYNLDANLAKDSNFEFNSFSFGANSARDDINIDINESGAHTSVNGLYVLNQNRRSHHKVTVNHIAAHSTSEQIFKGLLQDRSRAEFNGLIEVYKDAQKTDAKQLNKNLLLSKEAHIDSRPQLNILADDVKCSHGSTIGSINANELFYLRSRGLSEADAKAILTYSFAQELIDKIDMASVRNYASNLAYSSLRSEASKESNSTIETLAENTKFKRHRL